MTRPRTEITPAERDLARKMRRSGLSTVKIAEHLGRGTETIRILTRDIAVDTRAAANRRRAATPPKWIDQARALLDQGMTRYAAARSLNIPTSVFYRAVDRFIGRP